MSTADASAARILERLDQEVTGLVGLQERADARASSLLNVAGVILAVVVTILAAATSSVKSLGATLVLSTGWTGAVILAIATALLIVSVRPRRVYLGDRRRGQRLIFADLESWEKAAATAVERAAKTLRDLRVAEVVKLDMELEDGQVRAYRARVQISFKLEDPS